MADKHEELEKLVDAFMDSSDQKMYRNEFLKDIENLYQTNEEKE